MENGGFAGDVIPPSLIATVQKILLSASVKRDEKLTLDST